jgi:N-acetylglucosaminyl-diphospho-decaprenol L-rhamnosyltransferase
VSAPTVPASRVATGERLVEDRDARVACVVVAYHRAAPLRALLAHITEHGSEVVVVNVEDDPEIADVARGTTVVGLSGNPGYAAAVNIGAAACVAPIVVFMNDDVVCDPSAVDVLADAIRAGADVALPQLVDGAGRPTPSIAALPGVRALLVEWAALPDRPVPGLVGRIRVEKWRRPAAPERVGAASAPVVAVRRALLDAHPLPEDYFLYWEESEWFFRLAEVGAKVEYRPDAVVVHRGGRDDVRPEKARLLARNAVRCVRRTRGRGAAAAAYPAVIAWWTRLLLVDAALALLGRRSWSSVAARRAGLGAAIGAWREVTR